MGLDHQLFRGVVRVRVLINDGCGIQLLLAVAKVPKAQLKKVEPMVVPTKYFM